MVAAVRGSKARGPRAASELGAFLREELARSPLASQSALAAKASVSDTVVSDLMTANRPLPLDTVLAIARAISADATWLEAVQQRWLAAKAEWAGQSRQLPADHLERPANVDPTLRDGQGRPVWMVPAPGRELVERDEDAERLAASVLAGHPVIGVVGAGGFGKTTLVGQVCHRVREAFPGGVLWVTLGTPRGSLRRLDDCPAVHPQVSRRSRGRGRPA